jgi:hypothetical protein
MTMMMGMMCGYDRDDDVGMTMMMCGYDRDDDVGMTVMMMMMRIARSGPGM